MSNLQLCPLCNLHTKIALDNTNNNSILIKCKCGSCSYDEIKIWKNEPPFNKNKHIKVLEGHPRGVYSLLYIKKKEI